MELTGSKFVYVDWHNDYDRHLMSQCANCCSRVFLNNPLDKRARGIVRFLYKAHMSPKVNKVIRVPFKKIWNQFFLEKRIKKALTKQDNVIFVFSGMACKYLNIELTKHLKKTYPNSRNIYLFSDKVETVAHLSSIEAIKAGFDVVLSYNDKDVEKHSLIKEPLRPYDYSTVEDDEKIEGSDIFYVGKDKGRIKDIIRVFEKAKSLNLKCDFTVLGVPQEQREYCDEIEYEKRISYPEMLKRVKRSKSVLNIVQDGADGVTLRDYEAITMNKLLITNSKKIKELPNYNEDMFIDLEDLDAQLDKIVKFHGKAAWNGNIIMPYEEYFDKLEKICSD